MDDIINKMTLAEKVILLDAADFWHTKAINRLGIDKITVSDGPHGLRKEKIENDKTITVKATCFPAAATNACSWDIDLIGRMGAAIAQEAAKEDVDIILGPAINIKRSPLCGRNFEYFSEDPYLAGKLASAYIKGVQNQGVGTSLKHFAANNQESYRAITSSEIDERTLHEIYLRPFEIAVKEAAPWTVMCSYNKINGIYASENKYLLTDVLRNFWGFNGAVISDWGAVSNRVKGITAGLDIEFPTSNGFNSNKIMQALISGQITPYEIDVCIRNILNLFYKVKNTQKTTYYNEEENHQLSREIAQNSIVLLKNEDKILPIDKNQKLLIIGALAKYPRFQGGGSSKINPNRIVSIINGLDNCKANYEYLDGYDINSDIIDFHMINAAVQAAKIHKNVLVFIGLTDAFESEAYDRTHMKMPESHYALIEELLKVNPNIIVAIVGGSPIELDVILKAKAIIYQYLTGQAGDAVLDIIWGNVNPSGKLAETIPFKLEHNPSYNNFTTDNNSVHYKETLFVGYRYYDTFEQSVAFAFGHGLSYTDFSLNLIDLKYNEASQKINVKLKLTNIGSRAGAEVIQLYVGKNDSAVIRPKKELKAFKKVFLKAGKSQEVEAEIDVKSLSYYNTVEKKWTLEGGNYEIYIGNSSQNIIIQKEINIKGDYSILPKYIPPKKPVLNDEEFSLLLNRPLIPKSKKHIRPFNLDSTINAMSITLIGKIVKKKIKKQYKQHLNNQMPDNERFVQSIFELPLRMLSMLSDGVLTMPKMLAIIDIANKKFFRGIWRYLHSNKIKRNLL